MWETTGLFFSTAELQSKLFGLGGGRPMKTLLKRLVLILVLALAAAALWEQRGRLALLSNHSLKIQGDWYQLELERKGVVPYTFSERIITRDGTEWGSYKLRSNTKLEVMVADRMTEYELSFPDDENMVWSVWIDDKLVPSVKWRR